jgi:hypothetical protein
MARKKTGDPVRKITNAKLVADQADALIDYAGKALVAAEQLGIKNKPAEGLSLAEGERAVLAALPLTPPKVKKKLAKTETDVSVAEVASTVLAVADAFADAQVHQKIILLHLAKKLMECLQQNLVLPDEPVKAKQSKSTGTVYQIKITLKESHPPIWRRIQVKDCTLDKLHEHIQTAMGWTNSHLHHFEFGKQLYGDPMLIGDNFEDMEYEDSTTTNLSDIIPENRRKFRFDYEYDFGDSWHHEILWEGCPKEEPGKKYPRCVEGERACPPEDCGGIWGYPNFIEALKNPDHERHEELLEWIGGKFDPEVFDAVAATKAMKKGLGDWREEAW